MVFVTGEAGLGKTTLVETFVEAASHHDDLWLGHGQCIEHYGAGEADMPVLAALGRLCRVAGGEELVALLTQHAPTWLVQMPGLLGTADLETLQRRVVGATRERMLRELAEAIGADGHKALVLVLEICTGAIIPRSIWWHYWQGRTGPAAAAWHLSPGRSAMANHPRRR